MVITENLQERKLAASGLGHFVEQEPVYRFADTERKHARVLMLLNFGNDLHVVSDVTISHEANDAHV